MMPLASLVESGLADGRIDIAVWPDEVGLACRPDVVVWQRQVEDGQIEAMARWRKAMPDAVFIYELDDCLEDLPELSFHRSFIPNDIKARIRHALTYCDRISTTTEPTAHWLQSLAPPDCRVDVVPNALPAARFRERKARSSGKLRIGFAGGISHTGDIEILRPAMASIGNAVTWVFFGMNMEDPPVEIEFHEGVAPTLYLDKMATLDCDLMLAPLEDNPFNRCKSNLRLIETASVGAAAIAQDLTPYHVNKPPVFAYASSAEGWERSIRDFIAASRTERQNSADALRAWVGRHYTLERVMPVRAEAWLPQKQQPWRPNTSFSEISGKLVVACGDGVDVQKRMPFLGDFRKVTTGLEEACRIALKTNANVLWLRDGTTFDENGLRQLRKGLRKDANVASVVPLASDGSNGFPRADQPTLLPVPAIGVLADLTAKQFGDRSLLINAPTGPLVYLSGRALAALGIPDVEGCDGNAEQALLEWGLRAISRNWKHVQMPGAFAASSLPPPQPTQTAVLRLQARGLGEYLKPSVDALLPLEDRAELELGLLRATWGGPRPGTMGFDNSYESWSLLRQIQDDLQKIDGQEWKSPAVCVRKFGAKKDWSDDAYVVFVDDTVQLKNAVWRFEEVLALSHKPLPLILYGDNDTIIADKANPEFKPDFDLTLFLAQDYVTPVCAVDAEILTEVPSSRTELFQLILQTALQRGSRFIHHIPHIMASVKLDSAPETLALETLERQLVVEKTFGWAVKATASRQIMGCLSVIFNWQALLEDQAAPPLVSIIVPTLGSGRLIQICVATILQHTAYPNYEIIVVQNGYQRTEPELTDVVRTDPRVKVVYYTDEFHWSKINNWAIRSHAHGEFIVTMNDDVSIGSKHWLDLLMGQALRPGIGVVGAKLVHPMGIIQHVGVVCHHGVAGHVHKGMPHGHAGHLGRGLLAHEAIAVTGACMLFSRLSFDDVGGFEVSLSHNYNDTVFCVQQYKRGRRNVVETAAELMHPEASSRPDSATPAGRALLIKDTIRLLQLCPDSDPYWNPNMALSADSDGVMIQGLNADVLAWTDFSPQADSKRVLLINDRPGAESWLVQVLRDGDVPFLADLSGFTLRLTAPGPLNAQPWDIRDIARLKADLKKLGIDQIIIFSLVGQNGAAAPVETLRTLTTIRLGIEVKIQPVDVLTVAPWLAEDGRENDVKTFGYVDTAAWKAAFADAMGEV